ncbi:MAG: type I-E CRISPR-associated protein Cse1/CasA [Anaerolineales bacterium]|jgi:CRISPR system Cascade subunit CasA|nr:type I-E CRISPR-associated protein Cse1/CasA [Anaerolineales bacterium]
MTYSFDLIDQPWIPCVGLNQRTGELSLRQVFTHARRVRGLAGASPLETAALYRLLLAILHSALRGPESATQWRDLWRAGTWDTPWLHEYLDRWKHRFDLFDPQRPFYQVIEDRMAEKPALQLVHGMGTANELFEHESITEDRILNSRQAAITLLVAQAFGLGGLCHPQLKITLTNAPWTRGIIFLVEGDNLFETLALNLLRYSDGKPLPVIGEDLPAWEMDNPFLPTRNQPRGYLDYLTWQNRKLLLVPEDGSDGVIVRKIKIARGLDLDDVRDPWKQYTAKDKGWRHWVFQEDRSLWRDSHTLFRRHQNDENWPPKTFEWIASLVENGYLDSKQIYRTLALGMGTHYKDAKIFFYREEVMPLPLAYFESQNSEELVGLLTDALAWAEKVRGKLWGAVNTLAKYIASPSLDLPNGRKPDPRDVDKLTDHWAVERFYWGALELPFFHLLEDLPKRPQEALDTWKMTLRRTAWNALEQATNLAGDSPAALKAAVRARSMLGGSLKELFPETIPVEEPV